MPRSERSGAMTSSAEEDVFFSNFARHSSLVRKKSSGLLDNHDDSNEDPGISFACLQGALKC